MAAMTSPAVCSPRGVTMPVVWNQRVSSTASQSISPGFMRLRAEWPRSYI